MKKTLHPLSAALLLSAGLAVHASEDIDLFMNNSTVASANPNILFIIDNAGSNNSNISNTCSATQKKMPMEQCVIASLINSTAVTDKMNVGLSIFTPSGATKGGYIRYHVRTMDATNKATLVASVNSAGTTNNAPYTKSLHEAYLYFKGDTPYAGISSPSPYDAAAVSGGKYVSPAADSCQRNYVIFIGNGGPDSSENNDAEALLTALGGKLPTDPIPLTPNNYQSSWFDEYSRFMYRTDLRSTLDGTQNVITYTIAVYDPSSTSDNTTPAKAARALLQSAAQQGGGKYFAVTDTATLTQALKDILVEIQAVNSVFAAVTLPVSVNVRGTYLNQVYMGVFRPDADAMPRWMGNLKQYQLAPNLATGELFLADVNGTAVENTSTGFITPGSVSYWTQDSTFWSFKPEGLGEDSDLPDGDVVEKGAEAQWLRTAFASSQASRKVYTCTGACTGGSLLSATPFDNSNANITQALLGAADTTERTNIINWVRGTDLADENANGSTSDARASIHGDVLHSRPAVVNYNREGDDHDVMVFYGGNDGAIHAIQGGQLTSGGRQGGTELWSFIPSEFFGQFKRLKDNNVNIMSPNPGKPYFVDGPVGIYQYDANSDGKLEAASGDKVYLYFAMRRGGSFIYALDVTDPAAPKFMWKRSVSDSGFGEMGQTWSMPKPAKVKAHANPVLVMGSGYYPTGEDTLPRGAISKGRGIMVIDAVNGSLLWTANNSNTAGMNYGFTADMTLADRDADGFIDRIYAADTGANLWRVDIDDANTSNWTVTKLASVGGAGGNDRKFLYAPSVVFGDSTNPYDAVLVGSGDREKPFDTTITNRYYMFKDTNMGKTINAGFTTILEGELYDATSNAIQSGDAAAVTALGSARGWYVTLASGEKVVGSSTVLAGTVFFGTNQPSASTPGVCTNLGTARLYAMSYLDATATLDTDGQTGLTIADRSSTIAGGGFPPSPVPVLTVINGKPYQAVISGSHTQTPPMPPLGRRYRTYWHSNIDK
jgi:type IV pilus assembly protein PilY1